MVNIKGISKIGVGTYRMTDTDPIHYKSLLLAIKSGYNLVDTSTNYQKGKSEQLIGQVIDQNEELSKKIFIISKAGYIPNSKVINKELKKFLRENIIEKANIDVDFDYSIDPKFLSYQIESSLKKLNRSYIDCYMLHNPERFLESKNLNDKVNLYKSLELAFKLLEKKVSQGKIRYYGISSNKLFIPNNHDSIDLNKILNIANSITKKNHFKFVQFPFNFKERLAYETTYGEESLISLCIKNNLVTIGNRPLNMNENGFEFRLIYHDKHKWEQNKEKTDALFENFFQKIGKQLKKITDNKSSLDDFAPLVTLKKNYNKFQSINSAESFLYHELRPFIEIIYQEEPTKINTLFLDIEESVIKFAMENCSVKAQTFMRELEIKGVKRETTYPLTACHYYLKNFGINHVLMGLTKPEYVKGLLGQFVSDESV